MAKNLDSGGWIVVVHTKALAPSPDLVSSLLK